MKKIETEISNCFSHIVGQTRLVTRCIQAALAYAHGNVLVSILFEGQAGLGKTMLWTAYMDALNIAKAFREKSKTDVDYSKRYSSPSEFRLLGEEYGQLENCIQNQETVFLGIDEMSDFKESPTVQTKRVYQYIKKLLDKNGYNKDGRKTLRWDSDTTLDVSRHTHAVIGATNFPEKMPDADAMRSRFNRFILDLYNEDELTEILLRMFKGQGITANENTVALIAKTGRGTARPLEKIVEYVQTMLIATGKKTRTINREEAIEAMQILQLFPVGLEGFEVVMLAKCINGGHRPASLAMMTNKENEAIRKAIAYLQGKEFIYTRGGLVQTSPLGMRYLDALKAERFEIPNSL